MPSPRPTRRAQSSPAQSRPPAGASPCSTWACRPPSALRPTGGRHLRVAVEVKVVRTSALPAPGHGADTVVVIVSSARKEPNSHHTQTRRKAHSTSLRTQQRLRGSSTASRLVTATKRSIVDNATSGIAPPPRAWSIQTGQCSAARTPPRAVRPSRWRDQEAARSNRRESPSSALVTSQWCAQDGGDQPARTAWPPRRHPSRGSS